MASWWALWQLDELGLVATLDVATTKPRQRSRSRSSADPERDPRRGGRGMPQQDSGLAQAALTNWDHKTACKVPWTEVWESEPARLKFLIQVVYDVLTQVHPSHLLSRHKNGIKQSHLALSKKVKLLYFPKRPIIYIYLPIITDQLAVIVVIVYP